MITSRVIGFKELRMAGNLVGVFFSDTMFASLLLYFHCCCFTSINLVWQKNKQTNKQTNTQTNKQNKGKTKQKTGNNIIKPYHVKVEYFKLQFVIQFKVIDNKIISVHSALHVAP